MVEQARPLVSALVITYNQEKFIRRAISSVIEQTYPSLQIILSDDCSSDKTYEIAKEMLEAGAKSREIVCLRNNENRGIAGNINNAVATAKGEIIVFFAGDDVSLSNRCERLVERFMDNRRQISAVFSQCKIIDEEGRPHEEAVNPVKKYEDIFDFLQADFAILGAVSAYRRIVFDNFGPLNTSIEAEDMVLPFRAALYGDIEYVDDVLVLYRRHKESKTAEFRKDAENINVTLKYRKAFKQIGRANSVVLQQRITDLKSFELKCGILSAEVQRLGVLLKDSLRFSLLVNGLFERPVSSTALLLIGCLTGRFNLKNSMKVLMAVFFTSIWLKRINRHV